MSEPFIGEIRMFAGDFPPRGFAFCDGQLLRIDRNQALYSLLGTTYGGDGRSTFGLPDVRGRVPVGSGRGPGLSQYPLGMRGGTETAVVARVDELPVHGHGARGARDPADSALPGGGRFARATGNHYTSDDGTSLTAMHDGTIGANEPSGEKHSNMAPYGVVRFIIALDGIFPARG